MSLDIKTKVVQHVLRIIVNHYSCLYDQFSELLSFVSKFVSFSVPRFANVPEVRNHGGCATLSVCKSENEVAG